MDMNPFDDGINPAEGAMSLLALAAMAKGLRMPVSGVIRPIDYLLNKELVKGLKSNAYKIKAPLHFDRAVVNAPDPINFPKKQTSTFGVDPNYVYEPNPGTMTNNPNNYDIWIDKTTGEMVPFATPPKLKKTKILENGQTMPSTVARDIQNADAEPPRNVRFLNQDNTPFNKVERQYAPEELAQMSRDISETMSYNATLPRLQALHNMRKEYTGPLGQYKYIKDTRALAKDRKELRKIVKNYARELDLPLENVAEAAAVGSINTGTQGLKDRLARMVANHVAELKTPGTKLILPEKKTTLTGGVIENFPENAMINRGVERFLGKNIAGNNVAPLPLKTGSLAKGLAGDSSVVMDDKDILEYLGGYLDETTINNIRDNPKLMKRVKDAIEEELNNKSIGAMLKGVMGSNDVFIKQAGLRGRF